MSRLHQVLLLCGTGLLAALAGALLPWWLPAAGPGFATAIAVLALGGLGHALLLRQHRDAAVRDQLLDLRQGLFHLQEELGWSRREVRDLGEVLQAVAKARRPGGADDGGPDVEAFRSEVAALRSLVEQSVRQAPPVPLEVPAAGPGVTPAAREGPPLVLVPMPRQRDEDALRDMLHGALREDSVELVLQPIVTLPQRKRVLYECFSRLRDGDGTLVLPEQYIALAEREGQIAAIDNLLLLRCVQLLRRVRSRGEKVGFVCNVSPRTLRAEDFFGDLVDLLQGEEALARCLVFELTQADMAGLGGAEIGQLERLAFLGCRLSVDQVARLDLDPDELARLGVRFLKIGAADLLAAASADFAAPRGLKRLLQRDGIDLIVEKIESEEVLVELLDHEVDLGQGFLFGAPRPARLAA